MWWITSTQTRVDIEPVMKSYLLLLAAIGIGGCAGDHVSPASNPYAFVRPANFPEPKYTFGNNPVTEKGSELGRAIFYDPILSLDSSVACANCHQQARGFSDPVHRLSRGVNGASGIRNAPAIQNMAFQKLFFWDGGANHLDFVPINAITNPLEMDETIAVVVGRLQRSPRYQSKFKDAFGNSDIDSQKMLYALSQFMTLMISSNSRYDQYIRGEGGQLTADELSGMKLFQSKCSSCHATDLFTDGSFHNNGLDTSFENDRGRARITEDDHDAGKFKVPSLRNAELTSPYMHDGRFKTLENVLDHYADNVKDSPTLDPLLKQNGSLGITLTATEKANIIAFIKTLTDTEFTKDKRFSLPTPN